MIRIGNQTAYSAASYIEPFEFAITSGFDAFEWFPDKKGPGLGWDEDDVTQAARLEIRARAASAGIVQSVHVPWDATPLAPDAIKYMLKYIEFATAIGAGLINIHIDDNATPDKFVTALMPLARATSRAGLSLSVENTPRTTPNYINRIFSLIAASGMPGPVGLCLDIGHANLCADTRNDYLRFMDLLAAGVPVTHVHMHENFGAADNHMTLFTGPSASDPRGIEGALSRLVARGFDGALILEQWPSPQSLLTTARNRLAGMLEALRPGVKTVQTRLRHTPGVDQKTGVLAGRIALADKGAQSWREKLDIVRDLLTGDNPVERAEDLSLIYLYLRLIGTGAVKCAEDGRHFRPSRNAKASEEITRRLMAIATPDTSYVIRRIIPWLPSFTDEYLRPEPLTRIRDIAHRNDIPRELKQEIKVTLQNKLHRCAGPEDLATGESLLARIKSAPGAYPEGFVSEFELFLGELREFFNAHGLDERLAAIEPVLDAEGKRLMDEFTSLKNRGVNTIDALDALTRLRGRIESLRGAMGAQESQRMIMASLGLEDYAFVLSSALINMMERDERAYRQVEIKAATLIIDNIRLAGIEPLECEASGRELRALGASAQADRDTALAALASLERARRVTESFAQRSLGIMPALIDRLGAELGIPPEGYNLLAEDELRRNLIFQLSKLSTNAIRGIRAELGMSPWDVIAGGRACGKVAHTNGIEPPAGDGDAPVILAADSCEGDEQIPKGVTSVLIGHDLPHLSHFAVRARQARVVLATCADSEAFASIIERAGRSICIKAGEDGITEEQFTTTAGQAVSMTGRASVEITRADTSEARPWMPLKEAGIATAGAKAFIAGVLEKLSASEDAGFSVPRGVAVPFASMARALSAAAEKKREYDMLARALDSVPASDLHANIMAMRAIISSVRLDDSETAAIASAFAPGARLAVRSSSNCEDLGGNAGAGLYDSYMNVTREGVGDAVRMVWASLWTARAAESRRALGIKSQDAAMGVLVQEMIDPDYSFIIHTLNPISKGSGSLVEIAAGLGETMASGAVRGTPYRAVCDSAAGAVRMITMASFSHAIRPDTSPGGGRALMREVLDYSTVPLTMDRDFRRSLLLKIARAGNCVEKALGGPQDIEGAVRGDTVYLVQSRPQMGVG